MENRKSQDQYEKMTRTPVSKLVLRLGLPTTVSMLITNLYNLVDTWFVGRLGTSASGAVGVIFGLMAIIQAFGFMLGHGAGSNMSRQLGARNIERARVFSATSFYLSLLCGGVIALLGISFLTPLCRLLGSTDTILPYARSYALYILLAAPAMAASCVLNNILRYEGYAAFAMVGLTAGSLLNMAGDALFMEVLHMGIAGAGLSTAISQYISFALLLSVFLRGRVQSSVSLRCCTRSFADVRSIVLCGQPNLMRQGLSSISTMLLNGRAGLYGDAAVAAMSIVSRICNFLFSVALGVWQGFQPVSAFNFGAGLYSRVRKAFNFTLLFSFGMMILFSSVGAFFATPLVTEFRNDPAVIEIGVFALQLQCLTLLTMPVGIGSNMLFQSLGLSGRATFLAALRSGLCFIPLLLLFTELWGLLGVQIAQPAADLLSLLLSIPFLIPFWLHLPPDAPVRQ